jgi:arginine/lysine/ornithine decarboxylase
MASISTCAPLNSDIIIARNCHKSVYRTAELLGLNTHYLYPDYIAEYGLFGRLNENALRDCLARYPQATCVVITSPTYEGVILDISLISDIVHEYNMVLIVDEAHGAHLPFVNNGTASAIGQGADLVVQSLHKTLPSLTQTAVLHVTKDACQRPSLDIDRIGDWVHLYQSTSPSYILMASMDECFSVCSQWANDQTFDNYLMSIQKERSHYRNALKHLHLLDENDLGCDYDACKFVFTTTRCNINGIQLMNRLRDEYQIECEMASANYVIAMTSVCDNTDGLQRLQKAILEIDNTLVTNTPPTPASETPFSVGETYLTLRDAIARPSAWLPIDRLEFQLENDYVKTSTLPLAQEYHGMVSAGYVMCYPPGIPLVVPGEELTLEIVKEIKQAMAQDLPLMGVENGCLRMVV